MSDKDKFKFSRKNDEDEYIVKDINESEEETITDSKVEYTHQTKKRSKLKRLFISSIVMIFVSAALVFFALFWQDDYSLMAIGDSLWLAFGLEVAIGWFIFVYNLNIFSPIVYATKTLLTFFTGKRRTDDYYTYMQKIEENPVPKFYIWLFFVSSLVLLIPATIILIILL